MATFESFCERCGEPAQPVTASARGPLKTNLLRALTGRRSEQPVEPALRLCLGCRGYICANCWNEAVGRCQGCAPVQPVVPAELLAVAALDDEPGPVVVAGDGLYPDTFDQSWPASDLSRQGVPYWPADVVEPWTDEVVAAPEPEPVDAPPAELAPGPREDAAAEPAVEGAVSEDAQPEFESEVVELDVAGVVELDVAGVVELDAAGVVDLDVAGVAELEFVPFAESDVAEVADVDATAPEDVETPAEAEPEPVVAEMAVDFEDAVTVDVDGMEPYLPALEVAELADLDAMAPVVEEMPAEFDAAENAAVEPEQVVEEMPAEAEPEGVVEGMLVEAEAEQVLQGVLPEFDTADLAEAEPEPVVEEMPTEPEPEPVVEAAFPAFDLTAPSDGTLPEPGRAAAGQQAVETDLVADSTEQVGTAAEAAAAEQMPARASEVPAPDELLWAGLFETDPVGEPSADWEQEPDPRDMARAFRTKRLRRRGARPVRMALQRRLLQRRDALAEEASSPPPVAPDDSQPLSRASDPSEQPALASTVPMPSAETAQPADWAAEGLAQVAELAPDADDVQAAARSTDAPEPVVDETPPPAPDAESARDRAGGPISLPAPPRTLRLPPARAPLPPTVTPTIWTPRMPPPAPMPSTEQMPAAVIPPPARFRAHQPTMPTMQSAEPLAVLPCASCGLTLSTRVSFCRRCGTRQQPMA